VKAGAAAWPVLAAKRQQRKIGPARPASINWGLKLDECVQSDLEKLRKETGFTYP